MKISIVIPAYQAGEYIIRCIESLLFQTYKKLEIIIINDGSTDRTMENLQNYKNFHNITIINQPNLGTVRAKGTGIEQVSGDYVLIMDADDWLAPTAIEELVNKAKESDADLIFFNFIQVVGNQGVICESFQEELNKESDLILHAITGQSWASTLWSKLIKKELLNKINYAEIPDLIYWEDYVVNILLSFEQPTIAYLNSSLYYYFLHSGSVSSTVKARFPQDVIDGYCYLNKELIKKGYIRYRPYLVEKLNETKNWLNSLSGEHKIYAHQLELFMNELNE